MSENKNKLIQLSTEKKSNNFFTKDLKYEKITPFALEMKRLELLNSSNYGQTISFNIPLTSDLLYRCFFEISIPNIDINDTIINKINSTTYNDYLIYKNSLLESIQNEINFWENKFNNFSNFSNIQLSIYNEIKKILEINNFTIDFLKTQILGKARNFTNINDFRITINSNILNEIDILQFITNYSNNSLTTEEIKIDINKNIDMKFNNINNYLSYYYYNKIYYQKKYDDKNNQKIFYKWVENLNHFYLNNFELYINNILIDSYSNDFLNIYQSKYLEDSFEKLYNNISGNNKNIYNLTDFTKKIYTPLLFYFCKNSSKALPLIALQNSSVNIKSKINDLQNLIYFTNWEEEYYKNLVVEISRKDHTNFNNILQEFNFNNHNYESVELIYPENLYRYKFKYINKITLENNFKGIDADSLLLQYGSVDKVDANGNRYIDLQDWLYMMNNIKTDTVISEATKKVLLDYHYFIDYNYLLNIIPKPNISLLTETGYIDNIEKNIFTKSNLEYQIETHKEIVFDIYDSSLYDSLNDISGLIKEFYFINQPSLFKKGLTRYSKSELNKYTDFSFIEDNILSNLEISISSEYNLLEFNLNNKYNSVIQYYLLDAPLPDGVLYKSFSLYPSNDQISGCINFSTTTGQNIIIEINSTIFNNIINNKNNPNKLGFQNKIIYTKYNMININNGNCELYFYN